LSEDNDKVDAKEDMKNTSNKFMESLKKGDKSFEESDIDGLIKWAKDLPDDFANQSQMSFFSK
jgi:hypothetical protein